MSIRLEHPTGVAPPPECLERGRMTVAELHDWLNSRDGGRRPGASKWRGKAGRRDDLGHSVRSSMEANLERWLRYLGYQHWTDKEHDPPEGRWYRYEGRKFLFGDLRGASSFYLTDYEVWPGLVDSSRAYELLEVKGYLDQQSKTKLNRMAKFYPEIPLELITPARFDELTRGARSIIPGWE